MLNYNGGEMVLRSIQHLTEIDYPVDCVEIFCVDNGSTDGSAELIEVTFPQVLVLRNGENLGFPGNNTALQDLDRFDYVALVNSDAFVEPNWLRPLVDAAESDQRIGAVCPKILLDRQFIEVSVRTGADGSGFDETRGTGVAIRGVRLNGADVFVDTNLGATGWGREADERGVFEWARAVSTLRIPVDPDLPASVPVSLQLGAPSSRTVRIDGGCGVIEREVGKIPQWFAVDVRGEPFDVLNNVGSSVMGDGYGIDIGWLDRDRGQLDEAADVFAWCGGSVLLRSEYLRDVGLFDDSFFLYYEDTDLSWRGGLRGWRYVTVPMSRVRHLHAASSVEGSDIFAFCTERNRLLMLVKNAPMKLVIAQVNRFLLVTASYLRRDVVMAVLLGRRPTLTTVRRRLASFLSFCALLPEMLKKRRAIRSDRVISDTKLLANMTDRPE